MKTTLLSLTLIICTSLSLSSQTTFGPKQIIDSGTGNKPNTIAAGFIDGDAYADIVVGSSDKTIVWYKNNGNGTFTKQGNVINTADTINNIYLVDLNGDNFLDIFVSSISGKFISWYTNDGAGNFAPEKRIADNIIPVDITFGRIDEGMSVDIAVSISQKNLVWFANDGSGNFGNRLSITQLIYPLPGFMAFKDLDNDGDLDLIHASSTATSNSDHIQIYKNNLYPGGAVYFFKEPGLVTSGKTIFSSILAEDIDGDGDADILVSELGIASAPGHLYWFKNNGSGFTENIIATTIYRPSQVLFEDIDNDNLKDIVLRGDMQDGGSKVVWFKNLGSGSFAAESALEGGTESLGNTFVFADFDNDGDLDVASVSSDENTLFWFENLSQFTSIPNKEYNNVQIYPNPSNGNFTLALGKEYEEVTVQIYNILGQMISSEKYTSAKTIEQEIKASAGIYLLKVSTNKAEPTVLRIIKQ